MLGDLEWPLSASRFCQHQLNSLFTIRHGYHSFSHYTNLQSPNRKAPVTGVVSIGSCTIHILRGRGPSPSIFLRVLHTPTRYYMEQQNFEWWSRLLSWKKWLWFVTDVDARSICNACEYFFRCCSPERSCPKESWQVGPKISMSRNAFCTYCCSI